MSLTRDDWIKLICAFGPAVVLIIVADIGIREWRQPDVRYTTGSTYLSTKLAVASVTLKNMGHADAENVIVTASFADPLSETPTSTSPLATPFVPSAGGIGHKFVTGTIARLVPDESVSIYFITEPSSSWPAPQGQFLPGIKFNGGLGKIGIPVLPVLLQLVLMGCVFGGVILVPSFYWGRQLQHRHYDQLREVIKMGLSAAQEGLSKERLKTRLEEWYRNLPFFRRRLKEELMIVAEAAFTGATQNHMTP
jgi:hypothetical protein